MRKDWMLKQVLALNDKTKRFSRPEHGTAGKDFDFNGNNGVDFADVVVLFEDLATQVGVLP